MGLRNVNNEDLTFRVSSQQHAVVWDGLLLGQALTLHHSFLACCGWDFGLELNYSIRASEREDATLCVTRLFMGTYITYYNLGTCLNRIH